MKVELIPKAGKTKGMANITKILNDDFKMSQSFKGAIAFYSINNSILSPQAKSILSDDNSFLCVDINLPTNIEKLNILYESGCNIYLHIFLNDGNKFEKHLMHTKLLYFKSYEDCIIWNGSHNWTNNALCGPNIESSTRIITSKNDSYCIDVIDYLEMIKSICEPFDPRNIPLYKMLQRMIIETDDGGSNVYCAHLEVESVSDLMKDDESKFIHCLSIDNHEYHIFRTIGVKIYLILHEKVSDNTYLAETEITDVGKIISKNPQTYDKVIPSRYYFFRGFDEAMSYIDGPMVINKEQLKNLSYHVELQILECAQDYQMMQALTPNEQKKILWEEDNRTLHNLRMSENTDFRSVKIKKKSKHAIDILAETKKINYYSDKKLPIDYKILLERFNAITDEITSKDFHEMTLPLLAIDNKKNKIKSFRKYHVLKKKSN